MKAFYTLFRAFRRLYSETQLFLDDLTTRFHLGMNAVTYSADIQVKGRPVIHVGKGGQMSLGKAFRMNNGLKYNRIGRQAPCQFIVAADAKLQIGDHVGMSHSAIVCKNEISIGNHVTIGGNVVIYDTDFHSLDPELRQDAVLDQENVVSRPVHIEDYVFIGAHSTILKGVRVGRGAIIGACSVVARDIPEGEIWAGNPAAFIRKVNHRHIRVA
jgi:acetyltransferase-like isoleucine patch superfamily enzyme